MVFFGPSFASKNPCPMFGIRSIRPSSHFLFTPHQNQLLGSVSYAPWVAVDPPDGDEETLICRMAVLALERHSHTASRPDVIMEVKTHIIVLNFSIQVRTHVLSPSPSLPQVLPS